MQTSLIETYADIGGLSSPDLNLKVLLRRAVVPAFMADIGFVAWRRQVASLSIASPNQDYILPADFWMLQSVTIAPQFSKPLQYIGDDPEKVMAAEANTTPYRPHGYYLIRKAGSSVFSRIKFDAIPDIAYTAYLTYYSGVPFADDTTDVDLDPYIPTQFQWTLVEGLKKEIMYLRFGIGDPRYVAAEQSYGTWISRATDNPELARRNAVAFAR